MNHIDTETTILGLILRAPENLDYVLSHLSPNDFQVPANRNLYQAVISHNAEFMAIARIAASGGLTGWDAASLSELLGGLHFSGALEQSVRLVKEAAMLRRIREVAASIGGKGQGLEDVKSLVEKLNDVMEGHSLSEGGLQHISRSTEEVLESLRGGERRFFPTGVGQLDRVISGLFRGDFILLGGRPSMGKTAFAQHVCRALAVQGYPVGIFSMEMSRSALVERDLANFSGVDSSRIRTGNVSASELNVVQEAAGSLSQLPLYIDDQPALTIRELHHRAKQAARKHDIRVLVVDYLQLAKGDGNNDNARVSAISRGLKGMARDLNLPVLVLSQLNRSLEQRQDRRPMLSDLRDSGSLEQDADIIMFIYREGAYATPKQTDGKVEIIVSKQRCGPLGVAEFYFEGKTQSFR